MSRIVVPVEDNQGLDSTVGQHFGRAPYYAVVEIDNSGKVTNVKSIANEGEHFGGPADPHNQILNLKPNAIIAYGMGPRGLNSFQAAGITVLKANASKLGDVVESYTKGVLGNLSEGCEHAHHHEPVHHL